MPAITLLQPKEFWFLIMLSIFSGYLFFLGVKLLKLHFADAWLNFQCTHKLKKLLIKTVKNQPISASQYRNFHKKTAKLPKNYTANLNYLNNQYLFFLTFNQHGVAFFQQLILYKLKKYPQIEAILSEEEKPFYLSEPLEIWTTNLVTAKPQKELKLLANQLFLVENSAPELNFSIIDHHNGLLLITNYRLIFFNNSYTLIFDKNSPYQFFNIAHKKTVLCYYLGKNGQITLLDNYEANKIRFILKSNQLT